MGMRPCQIHGLRYVGPANHLYPAIVLGNARDSKRWSCCSACYKHVVEWAEVHLELITEDTPVAPEAEAFRCPECKEDVAEGEALIFLTAYKSHEPRRDFFGRAHADHTAGVALAIGLATQAPLKIAL